MADEPKAQPNSAAAGTPGSQDPGKSSDPKASVLGGGTPDPKAGEPGAGEPKAGEPKAGEPKAGEPKEGDPKDPKAAKPKDEGAPEKYETFVAPEGVTLDTEMLGKFSSVAKELNLPQAGAQKLVDLAVEHSKQIIASQAQQWQEIRQEWVSEIKADKEFGGEKFNETVVSAKRALGKFGSEKLVQFLDSTGYGDNAELIRLLARVDKATREDKIVDGDPAKANKSAAETLYPDQGKDKK